MSIEVFLKNTFEDLSSKTINCFLGESKREISKNFQNELEIFITTKIEILLKMKRDIFYDYSVYTGSAGIALYYYLCSMREKKTKKEMLQESIKYLNLNNLKGKKISFLCGDAGPLALATVVTYKLNNASCNNLSDCQVLTKRLLSLISLLEDSPDELLYGKAGYLYALLFVNEHVEKELVPAEHIEKVVNSILKSGKKYSMQIKSDSPLLWQWHEKIYLGAAHGIAGILYMLLQARKYVNDAEMRNFIKPTIDWLLNQQFETGNFPSSLGSSSGDRLVQWCHGSPGFVSLFTLAYKVFEEEKYLNAALQCGEVTWQRGLCKKGYSICHGVSGNAYAFIQLFQVTKEPTQLHRACCFAQWCVAARPGSEARPPDRPASLFEGLAGRLYLARDVLSPLSARFPAFSV